MAIQFENDLWSPQEYQSGYDPYLNNPDNPRYMSIENYNKNFPNSQVSLPSNSRYNPSLNWMVNLANPTEFKYANAGNSNQLSSLQSPPPEPNDASWTTGGGGWIENPMNVLGLLASFLAPGLGQIAGSALGGLGGALSGAGQSIAGALGQFSPALGGAAQAIGTPLAQAGQALGGALGIGGQAPQAQSALDSFGVGGNVSDVGNQAIGEMTSGFNPMTSSSAFSPEAFFSPGLQDVGIQAPTLSYEPMSTVPQYPNPEQVNMNIQGPSTAPPPSVPSPIDAGINAGNNIMSQITGGALGGALSGFSTGPTSSVSNQFEGGVSQFNPTQPGVSQSSGQGFGEGQGTGQGQGGSQQPQRFDQPDQQQSSFIPMRPGQMSGMNQYGSMLNQFSPLGYIGKKEVQQQPGGQYNGFLDPRLLQQNF